ncbi:MFS transporter [Pigmentiphaga sp.]|uniref:MFS transporter n=1 Tax=Pigmentiphaga sp. TaxID=1977564 RepID=UPI00128C1747|nr:MFS transporter [Pigmentiphaga sp.]MPS25308.1 MFS transporter [Alcaligenaceae bacterium SAGV5]MPS53883.1 MFS transporter [Alcaligenaceae bacterium SAGV3]MPT59123.1 MFS transporter [Alcaligenaceae bacterium]
MTSTAPAWLMPVVAICILQTISSFLTRLIPIVAPAMSVEFGWSGSSIGYLTASNSMGGLAILLAGSALFKQIGGMRTLQLTLSLGAVCLAFLLYPSLGVALAACFAMGLSNGAANPAGSEVLQRFSPPGKRNLMFSIKQAGVPLGGVMAGLLVPVVVALAGWRMALLACAVVVLLPIVLTWRLSAGLDEIPARTGRAFPRPTWRSLRTLGVPLASLMNNRGLLQISIVGSLFAVSQSCWFTFTVVYLVDGLGYSLGRAGMVFAVMQAGGVIGRIALGWLSDHLRSATAVLSIAAVLSAVTTALLGLTSPEWPLWAALLLAFIAGCSAASWNGVQIAEVARRSPPHMISETAAGSSILVNLTNIVAPTLFAVFVSAGGGYGHAFICAGAFSLLVLVCLPRDRGDAGTQECPVSRRLPPLS